MAKIIIDTELLDNYGMKFEQLIQELDLKLSKLFTRIEGVPTVSKEWVGSSSIRYVNMAKFDKDKYYKFKNDLSEYGKFLCKISNSAEECINDVRKIFYE